MIMAGVISLMAVRAGTNAGISKVRPILMIYGVT
nr:hypothetical protein [uncultured bacterium]